MKCPNLVVILSMVLVLGIICSTALAQKALPGSVLHLDATEQKRTDKAWKNLGSAGGEILPDDVTPKLKSGIIRIAEIGFNRKLQWYTIGARARASPASPT